MLCCILTSSASAPRAVPSQQRDIMGTSWVMIIRCEDLHGAPPTATRSARLTKEARASSEGGERLGRHHFRPEEHPYRPRYYGSATDKGAWFQGVARARPRRAHSEPGEYPHSRAGLPEVDFPAPDGKRTLSQSCDEPVRIGTAEKRRINTKTLRRRTRQ